MSSKPLSAPAPPRMFWWIVATILLMIAAHNAALREVGGLVAVTLYKAHLMSLGGWGGYWLDRALFPYDRPHNYLDLDAPPEETASTDAQCVLVSGRDYGMAMLRRAIIVAACLICVGLGA